jgi:pimeloyl-ACP methyl ester carboxylesterase
VDRRLARRKGGGITAAPEVLTAPEQTRARYPDEEDYVERDGVRVFYEVYGNGAPTVFLLPTWSIIHSRHWKMQIPYLARHFRVLTFDGRGNGKADRPVEPEAYHEREFAADALAVMDASDTEQAVIVGFSMGAQRSLVLAAEHSERVLGAAFIGPSFPGGGEPLRERWEYDFDTEYDTEEGWAKFNKHYWLRDYRAFLHFFMSRIFTEPHSTKPIEDMVGWGLETDARTLIATMETPALTPEDARALAARVRCPVLVVHGENDAVVSLSRGIALAEQTGGELMTLAGSGHAPHARDPVKVNLLLREFVDSVS